MDVQIELKRRGNEKKFDTCEELPGGGRRYSYKVKGHYGWIARYVKEGIIKKEGNRYIFDAVQVGATEKDFIEYLKDDNNNETVAIIKARFQELRK